MYKHAVSSVQFSRSVNSLWPRGLQHARPPCPSPTPGVYSSSCLLSRWCHPTISSSCLSPSKQLSLSPQDSLFTSWSLSSDMGINTIILSFVLSFGLFYTSIEISWHIPENAENDINCINSSKIQFYTAHCPVFQVFRPEFIC